MEYRYRTSQRAGRARLALLALWCGALVGCPTFEDTYTGTYVEVRQDALSEEVLAIDFFRFGDYANAVVRTYRAPQSSAREALLDEPLGCGWTELGEAPDEAGRWRLAMERDGAEVVGTFASRDTLEVTLSQGLSADGVQQTTTKTLRKFRDSPDNRCDVVRPFLIQPRFDLGGEPNVLPESAEHTLRQPTFAMLWLGVLARPVGNTIVWASRNDLSAQVFLSDEAEGGQVDRARNGLRGSLSLSLSAPEERALARSGETRYALAHFVVIDDACATPQCATPPADASLVWTIAEEPIVATALQRGNEVDSPFPEATGLGKALLYVEGSLSELHPDLQSLMLNIELYEERRARAHFYILDIFFDDTNTVVGMRLPANPERLAAPGYRTIPLKVTTEHLKQTQIRLPRLLPISDL